MERLHSHDFEHSGTSVTLEELVESQPLVKKAREFAREVHKNQKRDDGVTPYFSHLEGVARIAVEELKIYDSNFVSACFLHDCVEDQDITVEQIKTEYGIEVSELVEAVTEIKFQIDEKPQKPVVKVITKSFYAPKVGILKAACDRLHNMRTLGTARGDKKERKATETLTYARLLESLGVWQKMTELEDLSFYHTDKKGFEEFKSMVENDQRTSKAEKERLVTRLENVLSKGRIKADVSYKLNGLYRLKKKMEEKTPDFKDVNDVITYTVVTDNVSGCFEILNILRTEFLGEEDVKRFDDFLSYPTDNGYSAIQLTIMTPNGAVEIAITTKEREDFNNWGVISLLRMGQKDISDYSLVLTFTPDGGVRFFKPGATGIDYAYSIDRNLGAKAIGLIVDGERKDMTYVLKNGQTVEVIRDDTGKTHVNKDWLNPRYSQPKTRRLIEEQLIDEKRQELVKEGHDKISEIVKERGLIELGDLFEIEKYKNLLENFLTRIGCKGDIDKFYFQIGAGRSIALIDKLLDEFGITKENLKLSSILITGDDHHGIAKIVTSKIEDFGVNIEHQTHKIVTRNGKKSFEWRLVTEILPENAKQKLERNLRRSRTLKLSEIIVV